MEMTTTIKNPISCGEFFLLGTKEDKKVMKNKSTICVDRLAVGTILHSPQEQCDQMPYSPDKQPLNVETFVLPKLSPRLSRPEKEEDFLAIKGSKLPMKPKKRLKRIQNAIHVSV